MTPSTLSIKGVNEFSWATVKLKILISNSLDGSSKELTNFAKFLQATLTGNG